MKQKFRSWIHLNSKIYGTIRLKLTNKQSNNILRNSTPSRYLSVAWPATRTLNAAEEIVSFYRSTNRL